MNEIEKLYKNANIKPEFRYDCNLADTIKPLEVFPLCSCTKGEIKDYCTNKQDYSYCKVYKVYKIYPSFNAEKKLELIKLLGNLKDYIVEIDKFKGVYYVGCREAGSNNKHWGSHNLFEKALAELINELWKSLTDTEKGQIKEILE